ncbi:MAG: TolC family protein [Spirochaetota bacterium]|nr:TolC family protein [Spirochaetota bacterium]
MNLKYSVFFLIIILTSLSFTQENDNASQVDPDIVYFSDYVYTVINKLPDIQLNKLKNIEASVNLLKALKQKEWEFNVRSGAFQESDFTGNIDSPFIFQTGWEAASSLSKTFVNIGGRMNLDFVFRQFIARGVVDGIIEKREFFVPTLTFKYAQPLLKNAFGLLDRSPIALAGLDKRMASWTVEEENAYLLANYKKIYMQWIVYAQIQEFLIESLDNSKELEKISKAQRDIGYIDEIDYQNAKMLSLEIESELLDVERTYTNLLYQISYLVDNTNIKPDLGEWDILTAALNNESFQGIPFTDTRQALILSFMQNKIKHSVGALRNSALPELNLLLTAAMEVYSTNSTSQINQMILVPAYYVGLQFKYPLGDMDYKANSTELQKYQLEYRFLVTKYQNEFDYKMSEKERNLTFYNQKINNRQIVRKALEKRYTSQYKGFLQGRNILANLIDTRNKMLQNRIEEADMQLRLIFEYFDFIAMNNRDEISMGQSMSLD